MAQNYGDADKINMPTKAPTIQRSPQRIMMSLAASIENKTKLTSNITQAYIQSATELEREVHITPPKEMDLHPDMVLEVVRPV